MISNMSTHIGAKNEDVASIVLMPGDPLRAKMIADTYLNDVTIINSVRNMLGFTGYYKNMKITVMGSGMGIPSMGIYSYELFDKYDVECIIRIGTAGSYTEELDVYDAIEKLNEKTGVAVPKPLVGIKDREVLRCLLMNAIVSQLMHIVNRWKRLILKNHLYN